MEYPWMLYEVLEVSPNASHAVIEAAYMYLSTEISAM